LSNYNFRFNLSCARHIQQTTNTTCYNNHSQGNVKNISYNHSMPHLQVETRRLGSGTESRTADRRQSFKLVVQLQARKLRNACSKKDGDEKW